VDTLLTLIAVPDAPAVERPNGVARTVEGLTLPAEVYLITNGRDINVEITWDVAALTDTDYDPSVRDREQIFRVYGTFILPGYVLNPEDLPLVVGIYVTVLMPPVMTGVGELPLTITRTGRSVPATVAGLGLPTTVQVLTAEGSVSAAIEWNLVGINYDPNDREHDQTFPVTGMIMLPDTVRPPADLALLDVLITVTVEAIIVESWQLTRRFVATGPILAANRSTDFSVAYINHGPVLDANNIPMAGIDGYIAFTVGLRQHDPLYNRLAIGNLRDRLRIGLTMGDGEFVFDDNAYNIVFTVHDRYGYLQTDPSRLIQSGDRITVDYAYGHAPKTFLAAMNVAAATVTPGNSLHNWSSGGGVTANADVWSGISLPNIQSAGGSPPTITITQPAIGSSYDWGLPAGQYRMDFVTRLNNSITAATPRPIINVYVNSNPLIENFDSNFGVHHRAPFGTHADTFSGPDGITGRWLNPRYELALSTIQINPTFRFPVVHFPEVFELTEGGNVFEFVRVGGGSDNVQVASITFIPLATAPAANYEITLMPGTDHTFASLMLGYDANDLTYHAFTIANT